MSNGAASVGRVRTSLASAVLAAVVATGSAAAVSAASPAAPASPSPALLAPSAVIDLPDASSAIHVVADGEDVWYEDG